MVYVCRVGWKRYWGDDIQPCIDKNCLQLLDQTMRHSSPRTITIFMSHESLSNRGAGDQTMSYWSCHESLMQLPWCRRPDHELLVVPWEPQLPWCRRPDHELLVMSWEPQLPWFRRPDHELLVVSWEPQLPWFRGSDHERLLSTHHHHLHVSWEPHLPQCRRPDHELLVVSTQVLQLVADT